MGVRVFYDFEVVNSIHKLTAEAAKVKNEIFKSSIMKRGINDDILRGFISYINNFLKQWDDHCAELAAEMSKSSGAEGVRTIDYSFAKDYIYAEYDYAAILQFTDGVVKGLTSGKFTDTADIEKFYTHTVNEAFDDQPDTAAGLLESLLQQNLYNTSMVTSDKYQSKMYDTIKKHKNIHNPKNRVELYKASVRTIDFIRNDFNPQNSLDYSNVKLFISAINNIIDFIIYSITAFVTRIYVISQYAGPYVRNEVIHSYKESSGIESVAITTMRDMDNLISHDHTKVVDLCKTFSKFVSDIGSDALFDGKPEYTSFLSTERLNQSSDFCNALISNPLMEFLINRTDVPSTRYLSTSSINVFNNTLKSLVFNQYQGIGGMSTAKQEMMHIIRGVGVDAKTTKELQNLAKGLYLLVLKISKTIDEMINDLFLWKKEEENNHSLADINKISECIKILGELYRDIISATVEKARDIESKYNIAISAEMEKISNEVSIKVPGGLDKQNDHVNSITNVVPDTMRMPMKLMDMYSLPAFESAQMYDDFLRSLPEFKDSYYLNESVMGDIINTLISFLDGIRKRIDNFFNNASVKKSIEWVKNNRNELDAIQFSDGDSMSNTIMFKEKIELPKGYDNLTEGVKSFDEKNAATNEAVDAFIKSLYPNETIYKWFKSDETKDKASKMFQLLFLMNVTMEEIDSKKLTDLPTGTIKGAEYQRHFKMWIETVSHGYDVYEQYKKIDDELRNDIKSLKNKIVQMSTKEQDKKNETQQSQPGSTPNVSGDKGTSGDNEKDKTVVDNAKASEVKVGDGNNKGDNNPSSRVVAEVKNTMANIWEPIGKLICTSIQKQYKYLRDTYTAKKNQKSSESSSNNE